MKDYYAVLDVKSDASADEIKRAFKRLAVLKHPDRVTDETKKALADDEFKELSEAFTVLSDERKRAEYDASLHGFSDWQVSNGFENIFNEIFGHAKRSHRKKQIVDVELTFKESINGCEKTVKLSADVDCVTCSGTGRSLSEKCSGCAGSGKHVLNKGFITIEHTCSRCAGSGGKRVECKACIGTGLINVTDNVTIKFAPGTDSGINDVSFAMGAVSTLRVSIKGSKHFRRAGNDVIKTVGVEFWKIALQETISVSDVNDTMHQIKLGQPYSRIHGAGVREKGDMVVYIEPMFPELSSKATILLNDFASAITETKHVPVSHSQSEIDS